MGLQLLNFDYLNNKRLKYIKIMMTFSHIKEKRFENNLKKIMKNFLHPLIFIDKLKLDCIFLNNIFHIKNCQIMRNE